VAEKTLFALLPINRTVPTTNTKMTASITAYFPKGTGLEIVVRTAELRLRIHGKVLSMHPGFGMGVEFSLRTDEYRKQVQQLIECAQSKPKLLT
jgi:hypothetical protein